MKHLYCWRQENQQNGSLVNNSDFLELSAKVEDLENYLGLQFTFEYVDLNREPIQSVVKNPETNKIYIVFNDNGEENDRYNEYVYRINDDGVGRFELIGSGSFAQFQAHVKDFSKHVNNTEQHVTDTDRKTWNNKQNALTFDTKPTMNSTNPITSGGVWSYFPLAEQHLLEGEEYYPACAFGLGAQSHVCQSYTSAFGIGAIARNRGEIVISGGVENGSVISTVELILGTGEVYGEPQPIFNETKDGSYWVSDEPYLEIRITDGAEAAHAVRNTESVKISIRKLFDLLCANGGEYSSTNFENETNE